MRHQGQSCHGKPDVDREANQDDQNEYDCSPAHGSEIALSEAGAKLPYDKAAIASWCATRDIPVSVGERVGEGALNMHWLVTRKDTGERLVFRQRGQGHWLRRGFVGEALAQTMAWRAGLKVPAVLHADTQAMLMAHREGSADRLAVLALAENAPDFRAEVTDQLKLLQAQTGFDFKGEDQASWLRMAINDYCLASTPWLDQLQHPRRARSIMAAVAELGFDRLCLAHGDFRTGNLLIDGGRLSAVLDWEFAGYRPVEADIGWMLSSPWRYSRPDLAASGLMTRQALLNALSQQDSPRLRGWEALALVRWAVIARLQDDRQGLAAGANADEGALLGEAEARLEGPAPEPVR